jgi:hypothetical protein
VTKETISRISDKVLEEMTGKAEGSIRLDF